MNTNDTTPAQPQECMLQHRLVGSTWDTRSCSRPATHAWHRPGKTPIPCCSQGIAPGRDVRPTS